MREGQLRHWRRSASLRINIGGKDEVPLKSGKAPVDLNMMLKERHAGKEKFCIFDFRFAGRRLFIQTGIHAVLFDFPVGNVSGLEDTERRHESQHDKAQQERLHT